VLHKENRLTKDQQFKLVRSRGRSWALPLLVLYALPNELEVARVGISVSRRVGGAVERNRAKRVIREALRTLHPQIQQGWDLLLIARSPVSTASFAEVSSAAAQLLRRARLVGGGTGEGRHAGDVRRVARTPHKAQAACEGAGDLSQ